MEYVKKLLSLTTDQDMERIFEDFQLIRPTIFSSTPRFWNVLYNQYKTGLKQLEEDPELQNNPLKFAQKEEELLKSLEASLGGRLQSVSSGGAATSPAILEFMHRCFSNCRVSNGYPFHNAKIAYFSSYGSTESSGIMSDSSIAYNTSVKLVDVPELGYFTTDKPHPRGEICVKSPSMMKGYWKEEALTYEVHFTRT